MDEVWDSSEPKEEGLWGDIAARSLQTVSDHLSLQLGAMLLLYSETSHLLPVPYFEQSHRLTRSHIRKYVFDAFLHI